VLDQKLIRENPTSIEESLSLRGKVFNISNIFSREDFRKESFLTDKAIGIISGFGISSYSLALEGIIGYLSIKD